jgi:uncharacterized protein YozE (UPF0346 family)
MGTAAFFHGSVWNFQNNCEAKDTSRLRIEHSRFFKSISEEESYLQDNDESDRFDEICQTLEANAYHFIRLIPFIDVWNAFWGSVK